MNIHIKRLKCDHILMMLLKVYEFILGKTQECSEYMYYIYAYIHMLITTTNVVLVQFCK